MKKKDIIISLIFGALGFLAGLAIVPYQIETIKTLNPEQYQLILAQAPNMTILTLAASAQTAIMSLILSFIGIKIARKVNLGLPILEAILDKEKEVKISKSGLWQAIFIALLMAFAIVAGDKFIFQALIPQFANQEPTFSLLALVGGVLYGGIIEEVLLRLFLMSLLVWIFSKIFARGKEKLPAWIYVVNIFITAIIFAVAHLPFATAIFGSLDGVILARTIILNSIGGLGFGYLYWKKGLEYAIVAHMGAHIFMQLLFIPLFY